jgi:hypothetical protein
MKRLWRKIKAFVVPAGGAAVTMAASGAFGPKAAAGAAALSTLLGLFMRRPQDPHPSDFDEEGGN